MDSETLLTLALGGGGATIIGAVFQAWRSLRTDASKQARQSIEDLERWRAEANDAREAAEEARDEAVARMYEWKRYAGALEYSLITAGQELPSNIARPSE
jgi:hypothetical protein